MTSFKRMTRGIKLLVEHVFDPIRSALQTLTGSGVPLTQYEKKLGTFRISLNFPVASDLLHGASGTPAGDSSILTVPFILPPLQEQFGSNENVIDGYELMEVSVGQDTRGEGAAMNTGANGQPGYMKMGEAFAFDLAIQSKKKNALGRDAFNNQVFSMSIPEIALINSYSRLNPHVQSGISIPFNHKDSYLLSVTPTVGTTIKPATVVNLFVTLKFKSRLRVRDLVTEAQNLTTKAPRNFSLQAPVEPTGDTAIEADTVSGVNTGFKLIDAFIDRRLRGGYKKAGLSYVGEGLAEDAAYEVISVPMFGSWPHVSGGPRYASVVAGNDLPYETMPWIDSASAKYETMDRAIIPINYPLTIHHVIIAANYTGGSGEDVSRPTSANAVFYKNEVGVGIMSGHRADNIRLEQVAYADWQPLTRSALTIDRGDQAESLAGGTTGYSWDILNCPLTGTGGKGYTAQGQPMFIASGVDRTRLDGSGAAYIPDTQGAEQVLDIRWKISNNAVNPGTWTNRESIIGYGGHWIYLICKKTVI